MWLERSWSDHVAGPKDQLPGGLYHILTTSSCYRKIQWLLMCFERVVPFTQVWPQHPILGHLENLSSGSLRDSSLEARLITQHQTRIQLSTHPHQFHQESHQTLRSCQAAQNSNFHVKAWTLPPAQTLSWSPGRGLEGTWHHVNMLSQPHPLLPLHHQNH